MTTARHGGPARTIVRNPLADLISCLDHADTGCLQDIGDARESLVLVGDELLAGVGVVEDSVEPLDAALALVVELIKLADVAALGDVGSARRRLAQLLGRSLSDASA